MGVIRLINTFPPHKVDSFYLFLYCFSLFLIHPALTEQGFWGFSDEQLSWCPLGSPGGKSDVETDQTGPLRLQGMMSLVPDLMTSTLPSTSHSNTLCQKFHLLHTLYHICPVGSYSCLGVHFQEWSLGTSRASGPT